MRPTIAAIPEFRWPKVSDRKEPEEIGVLSPLGTLVFSTRRGSDWTVWPALAEEAELR